MIYTYSIVEDVQIQEISEEMLDCCLNHTEFSETYNGLIRSSDVLEVLFENSLSTEDKALLDSIVYNHGGDPLCVYRSIIVHAIEFFNDEMVKFSAKNISLGITQLNKTKDVADYLSEVMRYGQCGSLYEVINEVNRLIDTGIPTSLDPFVTDTNLTEFNSEILKYLS